MPDSRARRRGCALALIFCLLFWGTLVWAVKAYAFGLPECDAALPGSPVLAAVEAQGIPLVCEPRPPDAPSWALGYWDEQAGTIRLWVAGIDDPRLVRKITAHELGHAYGDRHGLVDQWAVLRGRDGDPNRGEDFAEMFSLVNFPESGVGYSYYFGPLTETQRATMRAWWAGEPAPTTTVPVTQPLGTIAPPVPVKVIPRPFIAGPTTPPVVVHIAPVVAAPPATAGRVSAILAALSEVT